MAICGQKLLGKKCFKILNQRNLMSKIILSLLHHFRLKNILVKNNLSIDFL